MNTSQLQWALPRLERYIEWDLANRDVKGNGLLEWHRGTESGLDNSPVFDHGGELASTDFSVYAALEMSLLARLHSALGNTSGASYWHAKANRTRDKIHASLWDERDQFYYYRQQAGDGDFVRVLTVSGFAPLLLDGMPADRVRALVKHMQDPNEFNTPAPLPTVAVKEASYSTNMWRGPAWTNTNWFTIVGLRRYQHLVPEAGDLADTLQQQTVGMVAKWYEQFGTTFEFYDSADKTPPTTLERKGSRNSGGVRDYHWTAANTFWMLYNPTGTLPRMILE